MSTYYPGIGPQGFRITQFIFDSRYLGCYFNGTLILNRSANNFTGMCSDTTQVTFDSKKDDVAM